MGEKSMRQEYLELCSTKKSGLGDAYYYCYLEAHHFIQEKYKSLEVYKTLKETKDNYIKLYPNIAFGLNGSPGEITGWADLPRKLPDIVDQKRRGRRDLEEKLPKKLPDKVEKPFISKYFVNDWIAYLEEATKANGLGEMLFHKRRLGKLGESLSLASMNMTDLNDRYQFLAVCAFIESLKMDENEAVRGYLDWHGVSVTVFEEQSSFFRNYLFDDVFKKMSTTDKEEHTFTLKEEINGVKEGGTVGGFWYPDADLMLNQNFEPFAIVLKDADKINLPEDEEKIKTLLQRITFGMCLTDMRRVLVTYCTGTKTNLSNGFWLLPEDPAWEHIENLQKETTGFNRLKNADIHYLIYVVTQIDIDSDDIVNRVRGMTGYVSEKANERILVPVFLAGKGTWESIREKNTALGNIHELPINEK